MINKTTVKIVIDKKSMQTYPLSFSLYLIISQVLSLDLVRF